MSAIWQSLNLRRQNHYFVNSSAEKIITENDLVLYYRWIKSRTMKEDADEDIAKYDGESASQ